jgi:hypothetical protein
VHIRPKSAQHAGEQRFAAAIETADPHGRHIAALACNPIEGIEDVPETIGVSSLADEGLQLFAKDRLLIIIRGEGDLGDTPISQPVVSRIVSENVSISNHFGLTRRRSRE